MKTDWLIPLAALCCPFGVGALGYGAWELAVPKQFIPGAICAVVGGAAFVYTAALLIDAWRRDDGDQK